jgi:ketosteroid isomerase-like protein
MATDRVNLVREGFEAWNSEDPEWVLEHMTPDVEWIAPERDPFPGTYTGYEGLQISDKIAQVFSFDDQDKCVRVQEYHDRGTALEAAGLSS